MANGYMCNREDDARLGCDNGQLTHRHTFTSPVVFIISSSLFVTNVRVFKR